MTNQELWNKAKEAGRQAVNELTPKPMIVQEHENMLDDSSPVKKEWFVADGVCGFAWVNIRPASRAGKNDCDMVRWLRSNSIGRYDDYTKAWCYWISEYNQSMQKKEAYAEAMARVLSDDGIKAYAGSRLD
jgi:hypothetical protein